MPDILIVEDNPVNQKLIAFLLARSGYTYDIAENGTLALQRLDESEYRLVLMDMMMPVMNGYDATRAIRQNPKLKQIPVVALTANAMKGEDEKCKAVGCNDYIAKPYSKDQILAAVTKFIGKAPGAPSKPA
ncbi:MAG: response regulator [Planctomycetes bacterium]|nr:response regulator [Planctomycetota bacterium]